MLHQQHIFEQTFDIITAVGHMRQPQVPTWQQTQPPTSHESQAPTWHQPTSPQYSSAVSIPDSPQSPSSFLPNREEYDDDVSTVDFNYDEFATNGNNNVEPHDEDFDILLDWNGSRISTEPTATPTSDPITSPTSSTTGDIETRVRCVICYDYWREIYEDNTN